MAVIRAGEKTAYYCHREDVIFGAGFDGAGFDGAGSVGAGVLLV